MSNCFDGDDDDDFRGDCFDVVGASDVVDKVVESDSSGLKGLFSGDVTGRRVICFGGVEGVGDSEGVE